MRPEDTIRLRHMLDAAQEAIVFADGQSRDDLDANRMLAMALVKEIEIIGEAANQMEDESRQELPNIHGRNIIGMRHRLIHASIQAFSSNAIAARSRVWLAGK